MRVGFAQLLNNLRLVKFLVTGQIYTEIIHDEHKIHRLDLQADGFCGSHKHSGGYFFTGFHELVFVRGVKEIAAFLL
jgi:hypothetical protein